jgi:hypothetical protein
MAISRLVRSSRAIKARKAKVGTVVALSASLLLGGVALATPASAAYVGYADYTLPAGKAWDDWGLGWEACKKKYPQTQSIQPRGFNAGTGKAHSACYDDPSGQHPVPPGGAG